MLRHKAMTQAARYAFGFSGIFETDEVEWAFDTPERKTSDLIQRLEARLARPLAGPQEGYNAAAETIEGEILAATDETQAAEDASNPLSEGALAIWSQLDGELRKQLNENTKAILKDLMEDLAKVGNAKAAKNTLTSHQKSIRAIGDQSFSELCQAAVTARCAQFEGNM